MASPGNQHCANRHTVIPCDTLKTTSLYAATTNPNAINNHASPIFP